MAWGHRGMAEPGVPRPTRATFGTAFKAHYSAIPMTQAEHLVQTNRGEAAVLNAYMPFKVGPTSLPKSFSICRSSSTGSYGSLHKGSIKKLLTLTTSCASISRTTRGGDAREAEADDEWKGLSRKAIVGEVIRLRQVVARLPQQPPLSSRTPQPPRRLRPRRLDRAARYKHPPRPTEFRVRRLGAWRGIITGGWSWEPVDPLRDGFTRLVDERGVHAGCSDWKTAFLSCVDPVKWTADEGRGDPERGARRTATASCAAASIGTASSQWTLS